MTNTIFRCLYASLLTLTTLCASAQENARLGQIVPLSGPLANVGKEIAAATAAAIAQHNQNYKLQVTLLTEDDGNDAVRSAAAVNNLNGKVGALVSCFGTVGCMAQMKAAQTLGLPLIGPIAGAATLRGSKATHVFAIRASAKEELKKILQFSLTSGLTRFAVAVQDDGFGQNYWAELQALLAGSDIQITAFTLINPQTTNYSAVVAELRQPNTQALLLLANSTHSVGILKAWRDKGQLPFVMNLSGQANGLFVNGLKGYSELAVFVTVTPSPWGKKLAIQRDYQAAMQEAKIINLSYLGFEAYINARLAIEALKRSKSRSPTAVRQALEGSVFQLGGFDIGFGDKALGRFTDLSLLKSDGTFRH